MIADRGVGKATHTGSFLFATVLAVRIPSRSFTLRHQANLLELAERACRTQGGGTSLDQDLKIAKKPYSAPSFQVLDAATAKAELEATGTLNDTNTRQMLAVLNQPRDGKPSPAPSTPGSPLP
jgi:hypothetical protein